MQVSREEQTLSVNHWNEPPYFYAGVERVRLTLCFTGDSFTKLKITVRNTSVHFIAKCYKLLYRFRPLLAVNFLAKCKGTNCLPDLGKRRVLFFPKCSLSYPLSQGIDRILQWLLSISSCVGSKLYVTSRLKCQHTHQLCCIIRTAVWQWQNHIVCAVNPYNQRRSWEVWHKPKYFKPFPAKCITFFMHCRESSSDLMVTKHLQACKWKWEFSKTSKVIVLLVTLSGFSQLDNYKAMRGVCILAKGASLSWYCFESRWGREM